MLIYINCLRPVYQYWISTTGFRLYLRERLKWVLWSSLPPIQGDQEEVPALLFRDTAELEACRKQEQEHILQKNKGFQYQFKLYNLNLMGLPSANPKYDK